MTNRELRTVNSELLFKQSLLEYVFPRPKGMGSVVIPVTMACDVPDCLRPYPQGRL